VQCGSQIATFKSRLFAKILPPRSAGRPAVSTACEAASTVSADPVSPSRRPRHRRAPRRSLWFPGGARYVLRDLAGRGVLLLHRSGGGGGVFADLLHAIGNPSIASTAALVEDWTAAIWLAMSWVAFAVCTANDFTSEATTAKLRSVSPARPRW
jgi:hypothetical protein